MDSARSTAFPNDGYGIGDITATTIVTSSVLGPAPTDDHAQRRSEQVEAGRRDALARVAAEAAEIGLESAGVLAAAAGIAVPTRRAPVEAPRSLPAARGAAPRPAPQRPALQRPPAQRLPIQRPAARRGQPAPPLAGPPVTRRGETGLGDRVVRSTTAGARPGATGAGGRPQSSAVAGRSRRVGRDGVVRPRAPRPVRAAGDRRSAGPFVALVLLALVALLLVRALLR